MTRFDVAVLSLRILALYFWLQAVITLSNMAFFLMIRESEIPGGSAMLLGWALSLVVLVALGWAVFLKAPAIAKRLFPGSEPMSTSNRPEIGALALKICGLLLFADCLTNLSRALSFAAAGPQTLGWASPATRIALTALTGVVGAVAFVAAPGIARRMFGTAVKPVAAPQLAHVQAVTFAVVGIWLLVTALPQLGEAVRFGALGGGGWAQLTIAVLGLLLFLGGTALSAFWYWIQHAGLSVRAEPPR